MKVHRKRLPAHFALLSGGLACLLALSSGCAGFKPEPRFNRTRNAEKQGIKQPAGTGGGRGDALDREVQQWWGTPYAWGGTSQGFGVDCSAYTRAVMRSVYDIDIPRTAAEQYRIGKPVQKTRLKRGDLVFFNTSGKGVSHVGIYLGGGLFTHASNSNGVTIDRLDNAYYRARYLGARRVTGGR